MANTNTGISNFVFSQSPFFVRNDHPKFVRFMEAYYEYLEQEGKTIERAKGFKNALDVDRSIDLYTEHLYNQFLNALPDNIIADKNLIIKHVKDFYRARGTEKSIQFLMSILYDEDVNFYYPKRDILKASDGKWYQEKSLKVFDVQVNNVTDPGIFTVKNFTGRQIRGESSNAVATVESVDVYYETGVIVKELKISNQVRDFKAGEIVRAKFEDEGLVKDISANVFSGIIVRVDILERGNNYVVGQTANVESNTGSGAVIVISDVSKASIKSISPAEGGAGFQNNDFVFISGGTGSGANANVALVNTDESAHPNSYNIVISLIGAEANTIIGNLSANIYETFAYPNLDPVLVVLDGNTTNLIANTISGTLVDNLRFTRTVSQSNVFFQTGDSLNVYNVLTGTGYVLYITSSSPSSNQIVFTPQVSGNLRFDRVVVLKAPFSAWSNLTISCGEGSPTTNLINLSAWKSNSNVFFETYDNLFCFGTNVMIISSNTISKEVLVEPGLPGPLTDQPFQVIKKPNVNTTLANSMIYFTYANTGPIQRVIVLSGGNNYTGNISLTVQANTRVRNLGILGKMQIVKPGRNYVVGNEIEIINRPWEPFLSSTLGAGARGYVAAVNAIGAIESVRFKEVPGYPIGGSGYNMDRLPTANIISTTGIGGNVVVTAVLGDGERLVSLSDDIGAILKLDIISGGSGYDTPPTINLKAFGSGTAQAEATIVQGVYTYPGRYLNDDGHLSGFNFLQDGRYYHNYSYVVRIKQAISKYRQALKDLVHPIGMSLFGEYTSVDDGDTMNIQASATKNTKTAWTRSSTYRYGSNLPANAYFLRVLTSPAGLSPDTEVDVTFNSGNVTTFNANGKYYISSESQSNTITLYNGTKLPASFNVALFGESSPQDIFFKPDGTKLYVLGSTAARRRPLQFRLKYPWDISSAELEVVSPVAIENSPTGIAFSANGEIVYMIGIQFRAVRTYNLGSSNAWNVINVTASTLANTYNVSSIENVTTGLRFSANGDFMYVTGTANDSIAMFTLTERWNVRSSVYNSNVFLGSTENAPAGFTFKPDGTQMYVVGTGLDRPIQYTLSEAWNVQTAVLNTRTSIYSSIESTLSGIELSPDGTLLYTVGASRDCVFQLPLTEAWNIATVRVDLFSTLAGNTGSITISKTVV